MAFPEEYRLELFPPRDAWNSHVQPTAWTNAILLHLRKIERTKAGFALLHNIQSKAFWIKVLPTEFGFCKAQGLAFPREINQTKNRTYQGLVFFDPNNYEKDSACYRRKNRGKNNRGFLPDEVLFHELLHAYRGSLRLSLNKSMPRVQLIHEPVHANRGSPGSSLEDKPEFMQGGLSRYGWEEEFLAVVLTNIYISDPTNLSKSGLRRDWTGGVPLEKRFSNSLSFFQSSTQVLPLLRLFQLQQPDLFMSLAEVEALFNPLHAMVHHPACLLYTSDAADE